jgi:hypothetical protein
VWERSELQMHLNYEIFRRKRHSPTKPLRTLQEFADRAVISVVEVSHVMVGSLPLRKPLEHWR